MSEDKEKVKMSVFLEADVARAAKTQAALLGAGGVSAIVRDIFTCAHCNEPITDEFVIGTSKPTSQDQDKYGVFFHKQRYACRKASGIEVVYIPVCASCSKPAYQQFKPQALYEQLVKRSLRFYCIRCDHQWAADAKETGDLADRLAESFVDFGLQPQIA